MPRPWRDSTYNEPDGLPRYQFSEGLDATGVKVDISSEILVDGDRVGARVFNLVSEVDDDTEGTALLAIKGGTVDQPTGYQTQYRQGGGAIPTTLLPGQLFIEDNGPVYSGKSDGSVYKLGGADDINTVQSNLDAHVRRTDNPHSVTTTQIGAATTGALNAHTSRRDNPHVVTTTQIGAMPVSGTKTITGQINQTGGGVATTGAFRAYQSSIGGTSYGEFYTSDNVMTIGYGGNITWVLIRNQNTSSAGIIRAADFQPTSSERYKENITDASDVHVDAILNVPIKDFNFKGDSEKRVGPMAEGLYELDKTLVGLDEDGKPAALNMTCIMGSIIATCQKQQEQIDSLTERIEALEKEK